jgi:hypothetical protein
MGLHTQTLGIVNILPLNAECTAGSRQPNSTYTCIGPAHTTDAFQIRYIDTGPTRCLHARAFAYTGYISHGKSAYRITSGRFRFGSYQIEVRLISK